MQKAFVLFLSLSLLLFSCDNSLINENKQLTAKIVTLENLVSEKDNIINSLKDSKEKSNIDKSDWVYDCFNLEKTYKDVKRVEYSPFGTLVIVKTYSDRYHIFFKTDAGVCQLVSTRIEKINSHNVEKNSIQINCIKSGNESKINVPIMVKWYD